MRNKNPNEKYYLDIENFNKLLKKNGGDLFGNKNINKLNSDFIKLVNNIDTHKTIHTDKIVENGKLVMIANSKIFKKILDNKKHPFTDSDKKRISLDLYDYLTEDTLLKEYKNASMRDVFKHRKIMGDKLLINFKEALSDKNIYIKVFDSNYLNKTIFYALLSNLYINILNDFIPQISGEINGYLSILSDNEEGKDLTEERKYGNISTNNSLLKFKPNVDKASMNYVPSKDYKPINHVNNEIMKGLAPINSSTEGTKNINKFFGGTSNMKIKSVNVDIIDKLLSVLEEPINLKNSDLSKNTKLTKVSGIGKKYIPFEYKNVGINFFKVNNVKYDVSSLEEIINKLYHSVHESRKYLNCYLIRTHFHRFQEGRTSVYNLFDKSKREIGKKDIEINKYVEDTSKNVVNEELLKNLEDKIINKYLDENIKLKKRSSI